jgi:Leucine-rich repeat (LRR) protein
MEAAQKSGALVSLLSSRHSMVRAEFSSGPNLIKDDAIGALSGIKNNVSHLDLSRTSITDGVLGEVKKFNNLTWLNLKDTSVSDRGIQNLSKMPHLTYLNLVSSKVSDAGIEALASIQSLEEIYLWNSKVSKRGVENLRSALPEAKIVY